jgi:transposase
MPLLPSLKEPLVAAERDDALRAHRREENASLDARDLVIVDETGTSIALIRRYGWALSDERAVGTVPRNPGTPTTLVCAMTANGFGPALTLVGALDTTAFYIYVRDLLCPSLRPGQIVLLDNLRAHQAETVRELIENCACQVLFLPPYSLDFSPIERAVAKLKALLRQVAARTQEALDEAISQAVDLITPEEARNFIRHCGYRFPAEPYFDNFTFRVQAW